MIKSAGWDEQREVSEMIQSNWIGSKGGDMIRDRGVWCVGVVMGGIKLLTKGKQTYIVADGI